MAVARDFNARLAVAEERIDGQGAEIQRMRERLHQLEGDRAAIRLAVSALNGMTTDLPKLAQAAADKAVAKADERESAQRRVNLRDLAYFVLALLTVAAFVLDHVF